jgi:hypothetical protein
MIKRANSIEEMTNTQLYCHMYRHTFDEPEVYLERHYPKFSKKAPDSWVMVHRCDCGTVRRDYVEPETYILWDRKYEYTNTDGYLVSFVATVEDFRKEVIHRRRMRSADSA